jgi:hypothetical protein
MREEQGMTPAELACAAGMPAGFVSNFAVRESRESIGHDQIGSTRPGASSFRGQAVPQGHQK